MSALQPQVATVSHVAIWQLALERATSRLVTEHTLRCPSIRLVSPVAELYAAKKDLASHFHATFAVSK